MHSCDGTNIGRGVQRTFSDGASIKHMFEMTHVVEAVSSLIIAYPWYKGNPMAMIQDPKHRGGGGGEGRFQENIVFIQELRPCCWR